MSIVRLENVVWRRDQHTILDTVNWTIERGQHWALLGVNGSGKSSLLQVIAGYIWPTKGRVEVLGQTYGHCDLREVRKAIGWVNSAFTEQIQQSRPYETALDVVVSGKFASVGVYDDTTSEDDDVAEEMLNQFGCARLADQPFRTLSQGEKQRVLLARAWMARPRLLILDEPCTGLDLHAREQLLGAMSELATSEDAPTVVYVSHHVEEIIAPITHALLLKEGRVLSSGDKTDVLTADTVSEAFDVPVRLTWENERVWVTVV